MFARSVPVGGGGRPVHWGGGGRGEVRQPQLGRGGPPTESRPAGFNSPAALQPIPRERRNLRLDDKTGRLKKIGMNILFKKIVPRRIIIHKRTNSQDYSEKTGGCFSRPKSRRRRGKKQSGWFHIH